jgi:hypothetical protein
MKRATLGRGAGVEDERGFRRDRVMLLKKMTRSLGHAHTSKSGRGAHTSIYISIAEEQANQRKKYGFRQVVVTYVQRAYIVDSV